MSEANTLMDCVAEEDFYAELLDRFTELCLALVQECADIGEMTTCLGSIKAGAVK